jgi:hypothetical protein
VAAVARAIGAVATAGNGGGGGGTEQQWLAAALLAVPRGEPGVSILESVHID